MKDRKNDKGSTIVVSETRPMETLFVMKDGVMTLVFPIFLN